MKKLKEINGAIEWRETVGEATTIGLIRQGETKIRTLPDGTEETYSPYDELLAEEKAGKIKIERKTAKEKKAEKLAADIAELKRQRDHRIKIECYCTVIGKGVLAVSEASHRQDLYMATLEPLDTLWIMADSSVKLLTQAEITEAFNQINPIYRAIWTDYANALEKLQGVK